MRTSSGLPALRNQTTQTDYRFSKVGFAVMIILELAAINRPREHPNEPAYDADAVTACAKRDCAQVSRGPRAPTPTLPGMPRATENLM